MNIKIYSPKGIEYEGTSSSIVVMDKATGSFGVLDNHLPVISTIDNGYIEVNSNTYVAVIGAVFKDINNEVSVVCKASAIGTNKDECITALENLIEIRKKENRERNFELALQETELKKQIKKISGKTA